MTNTGHAELSTTEIYTQVSIKKLKAVHEATHPAGLRRRGALEEGTGGGEDADSMAAEALLAALAREEEV